MNWSLKSLSSFCKQFAGSRVSKSSQPTAPARNSSIRLETLEDRVLFDASPLGDLLRAVEPSPTNNTLEAALSSGEIPFPDTAQTADPEKEFQLRLDELGALVSALDQLETCTTGQQAERNDNWAKGPATQLIVVDGSIENLEVLLEDIRLASRADAQVLILDAMQDGISQISTWISQFSHVSELHLFAHADFGQLQLGSTLLSAENGSCYADQWVTWSRSLNETADILIYGCELAGDRAGVELTQRLAHWTGSDVLASSDLTGARELGGDWVLEYASGEIEARSLFSSDRETALAWTGLLGLPVTSVVPGNVQETVALDRGADRAVAMHSDGSFVVVWTEDRGGGSNKDIMARRFAADGTGLGASFQVNQFSAGDQLYAAVGLDSLGNFVVTWTSAENLDGDRNGVFARRFDANGTALGNEFQVNTFASGDQQNSTIAVNSNGSFVIVWEGAGVVDAYGIYAQRYSASGAALGLNFLVNSLTLGGQFDASISMNASGNFAVSWDDGTGFHFQSFAANGIPSKAQQVVSTATQAGNGSILLYDDESVAVTWREENAGRLRAYVRMYDSSNGIVAQNLVHDASATHEYDNPSISAMGSGEFVVAWEGKTVQDVYARRFHSDGSYASAVMTVNSHTVGDQSMVAVSGSSNSHFVAVWTDKGNGLQTQGVYVEVIGDSPVLDIARTYVLDPIHEGALDPAGNLISDLLVPGTVTTINGPQLFGMAIVGLNTSLGTWQFSLDDGITWQTIDARAINSQVNELALHLGPTARIRLLPYGDLYGDLADALTFRAWNLTGVSEGDYAVLVNPGAGDTPYSRDSDQASISIGAVNDAPTFNAGNGTALNSLGSSTMATGVAQQPDGATVVIGRFHNGTDFDVFVSRYLADGTLDTSFGTNGSFTLGIGSAHDWANAVAIQSDGKIVVAGQVMIGGLTVKVVIRLNANGSLDGSFGTSGIFSHAISLTANEVFDLELLHDGKILLTGSAVDTYRKFSLVRLTENGVLDSSFGTAGTVLFDLGLPAYGKKIEVQDDGRILVGGFTVNGSVKQIVVARFLADGSVDSTFGTAGSFTFNSLPNSIEFNSMYLLDDGKLLLGGTLLNGAANDLIVVRLDSTGAVDTSFQSVGYRIIDVGANDKLTGLNVGSMGKITLTGTTSPGSGQQIFSIRLNADGSNDLSFGTNGRSTVGVGSFATADAAWLQPDDKMMVVGAGNPSGALQSLVLRLSANGSLDRQYNASSTLNGTVHYLENGPAVVLDANAEVFDAELTAIGNFAGSRFQANRAGGATTNDRFTNTGTLGALLQGGPLTVGGTVIGTVLNNSLGSLVLEFNSNATQALVNSAIRQIAFSNSRLMAGFSGSIEMTFIDGNQGAQGAGGTRSAVDYITVNVVSNNNAPVLDPTRRTIAWGNEDEVANHGRTVAQMLSAAGNPIFDVDARPAQGIAITGLAFGNGNWQFSLDKGATWTDIGAVSDTSALLLRDVDSIRFVPNGQNGTTASLTFRAWDQTGVTQDGFGTRVDATVNGGSTSLSSSQVSVDFVISDVNDAPILDPSGSMTLTSITEDQFNNSGNSIAEIINSAGGDRISDVDFSSQEGIAITGLSANPGTWEYSIDNGASWNAVGTVSSASALLLRSIDRVRFVPVGDNGLTAGFIFQAWDQSGGTWGLQGTRYDVQAAGNTSAFSQQSTSASIVVTSVNDVPSILLQPDDSSLSQLSESNTGLSSFGTVTAFDLDAGEIITAFVTGVAIHGDASGLISSPAALATMLSASSPVLSLADGTGKVSWTFNSGAESFDYLAPGQMLELHYTIVIEDSQGSQASQLVIIQIHGSNDGPSISMGAGDRQQVIASETNAALSFSGTLTVTDQDLSQSRSGAVDSVSPVGATGGLSSSQLQNMLRINSVTTPAGSATGALSWTFDSGAEIFDFLAIGQTLELIYQITVTDSLATAHYTISIRIEGTNDAPTLAPNVNVQLTEVINLTNASAGYRLSSLAGLSTAIGDQDWGSQWGLAVSSNATNGVWQYRLNGSAAWSDVATNGLDSALLLHPDDYIRFVANNDQEMASTLVFRAWDRTYGIQGAPASVSQLVSTTTGSIQTGSIVVDRVVAAGAPVVQPVPETATPTEQPKETGTMEEKPSEKTLEKESETQNAVGISKPQASSEVDFSGAGLAAQRLAFVSSFEVAVEESKSQLKFVEESSDPQKSDNYYTLNVKPDESKLDLLDAYVSSQASPIPFVDDLIWTRFFEGLNQSSKDLLINQYQIGVPTFAASTASLLTVGYLAWIVRGGVLLTTFMSSLPTWKALDIVPLIEGSGQETETIEQIVDGKVSA